MSKKQLKCRSTIENVRSKYQPSRKELREGIRVNATFEQIANSTVRPLRTCYVDRPKRRSALRLTHEVKRFAAL